MHHPESIPTPAAELHVWRARLDSAGWPAADGLPAAERDRAARIVRPRARRRWVAARWALRGVLGRYLGQEPAEVELRLGERGKPMLAEPGSSLRFNLSHSGELALIAVAEGREVGIDVQGIGSGRPAPSYAAWTRREAIAKCHGTGLWAALPAAPVSVSALDTDRGFAASVAVGDGEVPALRHFDAEPESARLKGGSSWSRKERSAPTST